MSSKKNPAVHVVPHGDEWAVRREGNERATSTHNTQAEAIATGRPLAQRDETEFLIHGGDGRIRERDSYGNDPYPPLG